MRHCDKKAVTVNVTNRCNLRCIYCMASSAEEQFAPIDIPIECAKSGIRDALEGYPTGIKAEILRFFSPGEPTQRMDIVRECTNFARHLKKDIHIELQTNGYFNNREDTEWIAKNINDVWVSVDGWAEINDANRPDACGHGHTDDVEKNMRILIDRGAFVGVRSTIGANTMDKQDQIVDYYANQGIQYICFNPITVPVHRNDRGKRAVYQDNIMDFAKGFLKAFERAEKLGCILSSSLTFNFDEKTTINCRSCLPMPQLNPDGSISSCDKATYRDTKEEIKCFLYGEWDRKLQKYIYDAEKISYLQSRTLANMPYCSRCEAGPYCAGNCPGRVAYETGDIFSVNNTHCEAIRFLARHLPLGRKIVEHTHP